MPQDSMTTTPRPIATEIEEAGIILAERAAKDGDDFRVKIQRRASPAALPESVAIFDGATVEQLMSPEAWLSKFAGGSPHYTFRVVHSSDRAADRPLAIYRVPAIAGQPILPDVKVVEKEGWEGPKILSYAAGQEKPNGAKVTDPPSTSVPRHPGSQTQDGGAGLLIELQRERDKLNEDRHRMEIDAVRRAADEDRKRLEAKFNDLMEAVRSKASEKHVDPTQMVAAVVTAIGAVLTPLLPVLTESRKAAAAREDARLQREAERDAKREERESHLMEKVSSQSTESAKIIGVFTESLSTVARSMVQTVAMVGELREPPVDEGIMGVIKTAIGAWAEASARNAPAAPAPPASAPRQLPAASAAQPPASAPAEEPQGTPAEMLTALAEAIGQHAAIDDLASDVVEALGSQEFRQAIMAEGGVIPVLQKRLGPDWGKDPKNSPYIMAFFDKVARLAQERKVEVASLFQNAA